MSLVDTHTHLDFTEDVEGWIERAKNEGVTKIICVGTNVDASKKCVEIAEKFSSADIRIYATVGIHSQDGNDDIKKHGSLLSCYITLKQIAVSSKKVVGVGEAGFDFYLDDEKRIKKVDKDKKFQKELFEAQIGLAEELGLPLVVHCRNAWEETFDLIGKHRLDSIFEHSEKTSFLIASLQNDKGGGLRGVFHSWTGDWEDAKKALDLGFYISFSGIVTFGNAPLVQEVATKMPLERMLLETDSPYLSPEPLRGSRNEPKNVKIVGKFIADLRHQPFELISDTTSANATKLFGL